MQKTRSRSSESHETGLVQELSSVDVATNLGLIQLLPFHPHDFFYQVGQNTKSLPVFFQVEMVMPPGAFNRHVYILAAGSSDFRRITNDPQNRSP